MQSSREKIMGSQFMWHLEDNWEGSGLILSTRELNRKFLIDLKQGEALRPGLANHIVSEEVICLHRLPSSLFFLLYPT